MAAVSMMDKIRKASTIKETSILADSKLFNDDEPATTPVPMLNLALSGSLTGGLTSGVTMIAGESKHFKSTYGLIMCAAYLAKYPDAVMVFYDSEFGTPPDYFTAAGIDPARVIHSPVTTVEQLRTDITNVLNSVERGNHVVIMIDSIGNLASAKETQDAADGKSTADMTRARQMKSLFRIVTPKIKLAGIPCIVINHVYKSMSLFPTDVVSGGTGAYYSSNTVWIIGRRQVKEGTEVTGYDFIINVDKSRFVREKSKLPISVSFENGVQTYSGIFELGLALGFVNKESVGWYTLDGVPNKLRAADFLKPEVAKVLLNNPDFVSKVKSSFSIANSPLITDDDAVESDDEDHEGV